MNPAKILSLALLMGMAANASAGGIVAGGGGSLLPSNVSVRDVETVLRQSKLDLHLYFNWLNDIHYQVGEQDWVSRIFFSETKSVFSLLNEVEIVAEGEHGCRDGAGNEWDGYAPVPLVPNSICISSKRLAEKLTSENFRAQTLALVVHELAHLCGASEEQAEELQRVAHRHLTGSSYDQAVTLLRGIHTMVSRTLIEAERLLQFHEQLNADRACDLIYSVMDFHESPIRAAVYETRPFSAFSYMDKRLYQGIRKKLYAAHLVLCASAYNESNGPNMRREYQEIFEGVSSLTLSQFLERVHENPIGADPAGFIIRKITSPDVLKVELEEVVALLRKRVKAIERIQNAEE